MDIFIHSFIHSFILLLLLLLLAVTLVGPREKVEVAQVVLGLLAKGVRSAFSRFGGVG